MQMVKCLSAMQETWVRSLGWEDPLEKEMVTHSSILAWKIPWTTEPSRLQSIESQRVTHDWATEHTHTAHSSILSTESGEPWSPKGDTMMGREWSKLYFSVPSSQKSLISFFWLLFCFVLLFRLLKSYCHLSLIMFPENSDAFKQINNFISIVSAGRGNNKITLFSGPTCALQKWDKQKMTWTNLEASQWKN